MEPHIFCVGVHVSLEVSHCDALSAQHCPHLSEELCSYDDSELEDIEEEVVQVESLKLKV